MLDRRQNVGRSVDDAGDELWWFGIHQIEANNVFAVVIDDSCEKADADVFANQLHQHVGVIGTKDDVGTEMIPAREFVERGVMDEITIKEDKVLAA